MFGIRAAKIVQLRAEDVTVTEDTVLVRLGAEPLVLPAELAPAAAGAAGNRTAPRMFVESIEQEWVYPGARAGHHMAPDTLNARLRAVGIPPRLARTSALIALAQELPPVVLSRLTGLDITSQSRGPTRSARTATHTPPRSSNGSACPSRTFDGERTTGRLCGFEDGGDLTAAHPIITFSCRLAQE
ncbi:hypothetical protein [Microbacterium sp. CH12i]|uniref:hypothetical protein n=1 Tax=Microbacterium sp. CH12i TaxID=1479651 RepID=UPI000AAD4F65|nr:hypothetical protein [Microbacterium sp. CH12i]